MTSNSVVSLACCRGGFRWVSPCIQEVGRMSIKRCPLSCNRWHSLGVCPSGLYICCGSRKESTSGLFSFLWRVPTGIWDVRTVLSFDHWCRICFVVDCSKRKSRSSFVSDLVYCFHWPDSDLIAPAKAGRCVSIFRSLGLHSCPIWGNLGPFQSWTSSMQIFTGKLMEWMLKNRPFGWTFILSRCSQQWLVSVKSFQMAVYCPPHPSLRPLLIPPLGGRNLTLLMWVDIYDMQDVQAVAVTTQRSTIIILSKGINFFSPELEERHCEDPSCHAWLPGCRIIAPQLTLPQVLPSLSWWCQELMMTPSSLFGGKSNCMAVTLVLSLFRVYLILLLFNSFV